MTQRLMKCPVDRLEEGMIIAQDILIGNGSLVLDAGTKVDSECIKILLNGNIRYVTIEAEDVDIIRIQNEEKIKSKLILSPLPKGEDSIDKKKLMFRDCI